eukprot:GHVT01096655.1.p1 GENE.GHVT01096655.1~~GHVT01096655.1.p1  ORF type:complete len:493 (-),score=75.16 GHVT01096655.1:123-1601(-)
MKTLYQPRVWPPPSAELLAVTAEAEAGASGGGRSASIAGECEAAVDAEFATVAGGTRGADQLIEAAREAGPPKRPIQEPSTDPSHPIDVDSVELPRTSSASQHVEKPPQGECCVPELGPGARLESSPQLSVPGPTIPPASAVSTYPRQPHSTGTNANSEMQTIESSLGRLAYASPRTLPPPDTCDPTTSSSAKEKFAGPQEERRKRFARDPAVSSAPDDSCGAASCDFSFPSASRWLTNGAVGPGAAMSRPQRSIFVLHSDSGQGIFSRRLLLLLASGRGGPTRRYNPFGRPSRVRKNDSLQGRGSNVWKAVRWGRARTARGCVCLAGRGLVAEPPRCCRNDGISCRLGRRQVQRCGSFCSLKVAASSATTLVFCQKKPAGHCRAVRSGLRRASSTDMPARGSHEPPPRPAPSPNSQTAPAQTARPFPRARPFVADTEAPSRQASASREDAAITQCRGSYPQRRPRFLHRQVTRFSTIACILPPTEVEEPPV